MSSVNQSDLFLPGGTEDGGAEKIECVNTKNNDGDNANSDLPVNGELQCDWQANSDAYMDQKFKEFWEQPLRTGKNRRKAKRKRKRSSMALALPTYNKSNEASAVVALLETKLQNVNDEPDVVSLPDDDYDQEIMICSENELAMDGTNFCNRPEEILSKNCEAQWMDTSEAESLRKHLLSIPSTSAFDQRGPKGPNCIGQVMRQAQCSDLSQKSDLAMQFARTLKINELLQTGDISSNEGGWLSGKKQEFGRNMSLEVSGHCGTTTECDESKRFQNISESDLEKHEAPFNTIHELNSSTSMTGDRLIRTFGETENEKNINGIPNFKSIVSNIGTFFTSPIKTHVSAKGHVPTLGNANEVMEAVASKDAFNSSFRFFGTLSPMTGDQVVSQPQLLKINKRLFNDISLSTGSRMIQDGRVEIVVDRPENENFFQIHLFECSGGLKPVRISRNGFKICASTVLHSSSDKAIVKSALCNLAEQLERTSLESISSEDKLPYEININALSYLATRHIFALRDKSERFVRAVYYCVLCHYHINSVNHAVQHFTTREHLELEEKKESLVKIKALSEPNKMQTDKVSRLIEEVYNRIKLSDEDYKKGTEVVEILSILLQQEVCNGLSLTLFGSRCTKLATKESNLNLSLLSSLKCSLGRSIFLVKKVLDDLSENKTLNTVAEVRADFQRMDPSIFFISHYLPVVISVNCLRQIQITQLIKIFCNIRSQFVILAVVFRHWAETCSLTKPSSGFPKVAFDLMLVHFLQIKGLLPFVYEILNQDDISLLSSGSGKFDELLEKIISNFGADRKDWNLGEIWIELFRYYATEHPVEKLIQIRRRDVKTEEKEGQRWSRKRLAVEDPCAPSHIIQPPHKVFEYLASCFMTTFMYFYLPHTNDGKLIPYTLLMPSRKTKKEVNVVKKVVVRSIKNATGEKSNLQKYGEAPEALNIAVQKVVMNLVDQVSYDCDSVDVVKQSRTSVLGADSKSEVWRYTRKNLLLLSHSDPCSIPNTCQYAKKMELLPPEMKCALNEKLISESECTEMRMAIFSTFRLVFDTMDDLTAGNTMNPLTVDEFIYEWKLVNFIRGLTLTEQCSHCGVYKHSSNECPDLYVPPPVELEPLTEEQQLFLSAVILDVFDNMCITTSYLSSMNALCQELEMRLRKHYRTDCRCTLFGSAANGFGLLGSDADICLRFDSDELTEDIEAVAVIAQVAEVVRKMRNTFNVIEIPHAKVPIVKFGRYNRQNLEADVSLYNILALENTRLLRAYSDFDCRIHQLGIMVKEWAKNCEIGDASKGSLSSYSYIIMLIHYLQRTSPPVAPFLQEESPKGGSKSSIILDSYDVYFCNIKDLDWKRKNVQNVGCLWFGFLDYYATKFDFETEVVQIRCSEPLMKLDKGWQSRPVAIEDPFDLQHNLSSGVHSKTMVYIKKSFLQSRQQFGLVKALTPPPDRHLFVNFIRNLFASCRVGNGPPIDRNCCHRCRQIGHYVENCPSLLDNDRKRFRKHNFVHQNFLKREFREGFGSVRLAGRDELQKPQRIKRSEHLKGKTNMPLPTDKNSRSVQNSSVPPLKSVGVNQKHLSWDKENK